MFQTLRQRIEAEVPHRAEAIRAILTESRYRPSEADDAFAIAFAGFRLVDDVRLNHQYEPTRADWVEIAYGLMCIAQLTRPGGLHLHILKTVWPKSKARSLAPMHHEKVEWGL